MNTQQGNAVVVTVAILAIAVGAYFLLRPDNRTNVQSPVPTPTPTATAATVSPTVSPSPTSTVSSSVKTFTITGTPFKFSLDQIKVKKGDTVKIVFKNATGMHDWRIDEFNAATKVLQVGQEETIQFVANKTGSFEYYCSVGNHRAMGMKGALIVE